MIGVKGERMTTSSWRDQEAPSGDSIAFYYVLDEIFLVNANLISKFIFYSYISSRKN